MSKLIDLTGKKFGRLTVIKRSGSNRDGSAMWLCRCECGIEKIVRGTDLKNGKTKSCGCFQKEKIKEANTKHGYCYERIYSIYHCMKKRCYNKKNQDYPNYGGRGIKVCDEWLRDFQNFREWAMKSGYAENLTIDRIDNDKGYSPENCRWVTNAEQQNNRKNNHFLTYDGKTQSMAQWARELGINYSTLRTHINKYHQSIEEVLRGWFAYEN